MGLLGNGECVDFTFIGAFEHADRLSVEDFPVRDLSVGTSGEQLRFFWVVENLLEQSRFEQTNQSRESLQIPNDARAIRTRTHSLFVVTLRLDRPHASAMFFHRCFHDLRLSTDLPNTNLSFRTTRNNSTKQHQISQYILISIETIFEGK